MDKPDLSDQTDVTPPRNRWIQWGLTAAIVLACAVGISPGLPDPDLWGHVRYGRDLMADGLPETTTYSFTAQNYPWINHENLSEIGLALGADLLGPIGLLLVKCLLGTGVLLLVIRSAYRQGAGMLTVCAVALLVAVNLAYHWSMRPQLSSFLCYTAMIVLLDWSFSGWQGHWRLRRKPLAPDERHLPYEPARMRTMWLAPVLFFVWANSHGGFVAGLCLFVAYLFFRGVEAISCFGRDSTGILKRFGLMALVATVATLVNPYGPRLHAWLIQSLTIPRPEITEWHPPDMTDPLSIPLWLILGAWSLSMILSRRQRDFAQTMIMSIAIWQLFEHQRHIPFFAIAFGFWMPAHLESALRRLRIVKPESGFGDEMAPVMKGVLATGLLLAFSLLGYKLYDRLHDMPVDRDEYPVSALEFVAQHELKGKMVVTFNWAQYVIGAFGHEDSADEGILVGFDGRFRTCYPQNVVDMHFDLILGNSRPERRYRSPDSPPPDPARVLEYGQPDLVLISRLQGNSGKTLADRHDTWVLLYQDGLAQLWGRSDRYDEPASPDYLPPDRRSITDTEQVGSVTWPAYPSRPHRNVELVRRVD